MAALCIIVARMNTSRNAGRERTGGGGGSRASQEHTRPHFYTHSFIPRVTRKEAHMHVGGPGHGRPEILNQGPRPRSHLVWRAFVCDKQPECEAALDLTREPSIIRDVKKKREGGPVAERLDD